MLKWPLSSTPGDLSQPSPCHVALPALDPPGQSRRPGPGSEPGSALKNRPGFESWPTLLPAHPGAKHFLCTRVMTGPLRGHGGVHSGVMTEPLRGHDGATQGSRWGPLRGHDGGHEGSTRGSWWGLLAGWEPPERRPELSVWEGPRGSLLRGEPKVGWEALGEPCWGEAERGPCKPRGPRPGQ